VKYAHNSKTVQSAGFQSIEYIRTKTHCSICSSFPVGIDLYQADSFLPFFIDLEVDIGRIVLPLAGPRDDSAFPSYRLIVLNDVTHDTAEMSILSIQIEGDRYSSDPILLKDCCRIDSSMLNSTNEYLLYGIRVLGQVSDVKYRS
jgi:hypothetical protein